MYCGHARLCVCLSTAVRPHYCTDPDVTWGRGRGCPPSCALLGGFAIGVRGALLWQHNANPIYKLASIPRYDDIVRTRPDGRGLRALLAGDWRVTGAFSKLRAVWEVGVAGSPMIGRRPGAFSTLLRRPGLRASTGGGLATKSELKMLASTCLYSLYAWLLTAVIQSNLARVIQPVPLCFFCHLVLERTFGDK